MWAGETAFGPTEWLVVEIHEGVLLLETEPGNNVLCLVHDLLGVRAVVCAVGGAVVVVALGHDEDVVTAAEGVLEDGGGAEIDVGIIARGLVGGGAVKVPDAQLADVLDGLAHGL